MKNIKKLYELIKKDKCLFLNILVAFEWIYTFGFLIFDRGKIINPSLIVVMFICGYFFLLLFPLILLQKKIFFIEISIQKLINIFFVFIYFLSIFDLIIFPFIFFIQKQGICLYFAMQSILITFLLYEKFFQWKKNKKSIIDNNC